MEQRSHVTGAEGVGRDSLCSNSRSVCVRCERDALKSLPVNTARLKHQTPGEICVNSLCCCLLIGSSGTGLEVWRGETSQTSTSGLEWEWWFHQPAGCDGRRGRQSGCFNVSSRPVRT